jgi:protein CWC15
MTTAHRPTWNAAQGSDTQGGSLRGVVSRANSKFDAPGQTKLHYRQEGQNAPSELRNRDFKADLEEKERRAREKRHREDEQDRDEEVKRPRLEHRDKKEGEGNGEEESMPRAVPRLHPEDKDDSDSSAEGSDSDSDSDDDDETAELMRELERIQKERQEEQKRLDKERQQASIATSAESILRGNPLHATKDDFTVKKKWYEDTVFRNQTRGAPDQKKPRFINDTIRNDFHRKFLSKYIK